MTEGTWEDFVSLNTAAPVIRRNIGPVSQYTALDDGSVEWDREALPLEQALSRDRASLPSLEDREGYYGENHFAYWASGLRDMQELQTWAAANSLNIGTYLDFGCATGRVVRSFATQTGAKVIGCDINRSHVDWVAQNLPSSVEVFQNTSMPTLPLADASVDLVTAFSVFTHVEAFDTAWIAELRRVLRPGGVAWLTFHGERTWREIEPSWPLHSALSAHPEYAKDVGSAELPHDRVAYRWSSGRSYSSNVFYRYDYLKATWGRLMDLVEVRPALPAFQEVAVLRRPS